MMSNGSAGTAMIEVTEFADTAGSASRAGGDASLRSIEVWLSLQEAIACVGAWAAEKPAEVEPLVRAVRYLFSAVDRMREEGWGQHARLTTAVTELLTIVIRNDGPRQAYTLRNAQRVLRSVQEALNVVRVNRPQVPGYDVLDGLITELRAEESSPAQKACG